MAASSPEEKDKVEALFPPERISTIMKSSPGVSDISDEAVYLTSKATEKFIYHLTRCAYVNGGRKENLEYEDVSDVVQTTEILDFIKEIMPKKMTYLEYKQLMEKKKKENPSLFAEIDNLNSELERSVNVQEKGEGSGEKKPSVEKGKSSKELCEAGNTEPNKKGDKDKLASEKRKNVVGKSTVKS